MGLRSFFMVTYTISGFFIDLLAGSTFIAAYTGHWDFVFAALIGGVAIITTGIEHGRPKQS